MRARLVKLLMELAFAVDWQATIRYMADVLDAQRKSKRMPK